MQKLMKLNNPFAAKSPPPCRGRAREGVEIPPFHGSTPILTFPLQGRRNGYGSNGQSGMKLKLLLLATLLAASGWAQAADLLETFRAAQANDPVFAAARATQQAGKEKLSQGRSLLMPSINLNANTTFNNQSTQYLCLLYTSD